MERNARLRALIGFVIGAIMGSAISLVGEWFRNWVMVRRGLSPHPIQWWDALPLAIIVGLALAINMYQPPYVD
jgi:hypothetical protein